MHGRDTSTKMTAHISAKEEGFYEKQRSSCLEALHNNAKDLVVAHWLPGQEDNKIRLPDSKSLAHLLALLLEPAGEWNRWRGVRHVKIKLTEQTTAQ